MLRIFNMFRAQILLEEEQHKTLVEIAKREKRSLSDLVRALLDEQLQHRKEREMSMAAELLLPDYQKDIELTAFTALDKEDFLG
jgi:predicted CopG family antitoxin